MDDVDMINRAGGDRKFSVESMPSFLRVEMHIACNISPTSMSDLKIHLALELLNSDRRNVK